MFWDQLQYQLAIAGNSDFFLLKRINETYVVLCLGCSWWDFDGGSVHWIICIWKWDNRVCLDRIWVLLVLPGNNGRINSRKTHPCMYIWETFSKYSFFLIEILRNYDPRKETKILVTHPALQMFSVQLTSVAIIIDVLFYKLIYFFPITLLTQTIQLSESHHSLN